MLALPSALYERFGLNAYVQGDAPKALSWFRKLEAKEPDSIRVLRNLGVILLASGDIDGATAYIKKEERLYGESFDRHTALADIAWAKGSRKEAGKRYAAALADKDCAPGEKSSGARALLEARLAICGSEAAFEASREGARRFFEAEAARDSGDSEKAIAFFIEASELDPTHWPALNNAGTIALNQLKDPERALGLFRRALSLARTPQVARNTELAEAAIAKTKPSAGGKRTRAPGRAEERAR